MGERKRVALVLGGGGAMGCAHIGVIKVLEKYGVPIDIVVGTSMGGVVGAAYCVGMSTKEMIEFATKFKTLDFVDINFDKTGLFSGKGVMKTINKFLPEINIENLNKEFACVAGDLKTEKEVVFKIGPIRDAVRSTLSIPGIFVPYKYNDMLLVDGGVINNLPEDVAMEMGADIIISCDVISNFRVKTKPKGTIDTLFLSMNMAMKEIQKHRSCHADVVIRPQLPNMNPLSFGKEKVIFAIKRGEKAALKEIENIIKLLKH